MIKQKHQQELEKTVTSLLLGDAEHGGVPVRVVASMVGISPTTVMRIKRELNAALESENIMYESTGLDGKRRPAIRVDNTERDERIRVSHENGHSMREVAEHFGVSVGTVHRVVSAEPSAPVGKFRCTRCRRVRRLELKHGTICRQCAAYNARTTALESPEWTGNGGTKDLCEIGYVEVVADLPAQN